MEKIKVLHISNDFPNSDLYKQLAIHIDRLGINQTIYSAVRSEKEAKYNPKELAHLDLFIRNILKFHDRVFFRFKIKKICNDLFENIDLKKININHAHTLYSDGAVALKIKNKYGIPYIVSVRNSDINAFNKYRPDLKWRRNKILDEAEKVITLSPAYHTKLLSILDNNFSNKIKQKTEIIPNGLHPSYLNFPTEFHTENEEKLRLLFVGRFLKLKNIPNLIQAVNELNKKFSVTLTLVGGGGDELKRIMELVDSMPFVKYLGMIKCKHKLRDIYRSHDIFAMVSKPETFGLVYIEALSQGLPIIHTRGEGVDGYFEKGTITESVCDPTDVDEIAVKIERLSNRLSIDLRKKCINESKLFQWDTIAERYNEIYESSLSKKEH